MLRRCLPQLLLIGLVAVAAGCQTSTPDTSSNTAPAATPPPVDPVAHGFTGDEKHGRNLERDAEVCVARERANQRAARTAHV